jgi:hypothetical protein
MARIKKDFVTAANNPQKLQPPAYLSVDEVVLDGKTLLHISVASHVPGRPGATAPAGCWPVTPPLANAG